MATCTSWRLSSEKESARVMIGGRLRTPVIEQILERLLYRNVRLPPGFGADSRSISRDDRVVTRTQPLGIELDPDWRARSSDQPVEEISHAIRLARTDIVRA